MMEVGFWVDQEVVKVFYKTSGRIKIESQLQKI